MQKPPSIAVLGAGSWGTALAILLARNGHAVQLWGRDAPFMQTLNATRCNVRFLPEFAFPPLLQPTGDLDQALSETDECLIAVPTHSFHATLEHIARRLAPGRGLAWATKGLEPGSGKLLHHAASELLGAARPMAVISGPTFAREVARGSPTAVTVAATPPDYARHWAALLHGDNFRAYTCDDITGVEVGGAVKNVLAIAAGIADGLGFGANTRAALITRGLAEMLRLGVALGGKRETFMGLAGLGDLVLTCTDDQSRNRRLGLALARGAALSDALRDIGQIVEGVPTAREITRLAKTHAIDMPISEQVDYVLHDNKNPRAAVQALLAREPKAETL